MSSFAMKHPGGKAWIEMTAGTDATDAFETHHITAKADAVLSKYLVKDQQIIDTGAIKAMECFEWERNGFYSKLKDRVREVFEETDTGPTKQMYLLCYLALFLWATFFMLTCSTGSVVVAAISGYFLLVAGFGVGHNFFHQRDRLIMYRSVGGQWKMMTMMMTMDDGHRPKN